VDLNAARGTPVSAIALEHQLGDAELVYVGQLFGTTVVTHHSVREAGAIHDYLLILGHLEAPAPGLRENPNAAVREGDLLGFVGDTGSPGSVHLHIEVRRLRDGVEVHHLSPWDMIHTDATIVCDPRNVLPLK
jgi:hypothetical protein